MSDLKYLSDEGLIEELRRNTDEYVRLRKRVKQLEVRATRIKNSIVARKIYEDAAKPK
jgi:hypothetical protein